MSEQAPSDGWRRCWSAARAFAVRCWAATRSGVRERWFVPLGILALVAGPLGLLTLAEIGGRKCRQQPSAERYLGCLLREHKELAGGLFGAAGTILAGWVAWSGVQRQVTAQRWQAEVALLTHWQAKVDALLQLRNAMAYVLTALLPAKMATDKLNLKDFFAVETAAFEVSKLVKEGRFDFAAPVLADDIRIAGLLQTVGTIKATVDRARNHDRDAILELLFRARDFVSEWERLEKALAETVDEHKRARSVLDQIHNRVDRFA